LTDDYLVWIAADLLVLGAGNTWDDQVPSPTTWNQIGASSRSWSQIFALTQASNIEMKLKYGAASPPANEVTKMEILSTVINTFRYLQVEITITDPAEEVYGLVGAFDLKLRRPT
jgi:hypothetical protein